MSPLFVLVKFQIFPLSHLFRIFSGHAIMPSRILTRQQYHAELRQLIRILITDYYMLIYLENIFPHAIIMLLLFTYLIISNRRIYRHYFD